MEWNEEGAEEQAGIASDMVVSEDTCVQNVEKKEDNLASSSEENEWDKLLRVRYCSGNLLYIYEMVYYIIWAQLYIYIQCGCVQVSIIW